MPQWPEPSVARGLTPRHTSSQKLLISAMGKSVTNATGYTRQTKPTHGANVSPLSGARAATTPPPFEINS